MSIKVNQELCIGCGACVSLCPDVFKINEAGKSEVISSASVPLSGTTADKQENVACAKDAVGSCPVQAISVYPVK